VMNEHPENKSTLDEEAARSGYREHANGDEAAEGQEQPAAAEAEPSEEDVLMRLAAENEELKDRALRLAAEMENLRRRTARDVADAKSYSVATFARDMLSVSDNLQRALEAIPEEARKRGDAGFKALIEGVQMVERDMLATLERHGVKKLSPEGEKFDPNFHQAMFEVPNPEVPANTVVQVVQAGYAIGERVLRPAMVGVAKGGPKQTSANGNGNGETVEPGPPNPQAEKDA
jgi:molecular chaperone GrpE